MINNEEIDKIVNSYLNGENMHKKRDNGLILSDNQIEVLKRYDIDYLQYNSISSLLYDIEDILTNDQVYEDLDMVSQELAEFNYYHNTNK